MTTKREVQRQAARETVQALLATGLSAPELGKIVTEVAAGQIELTPAEFKRRYTGARIEVTKHRNNTYYWAGRVGGKYGRVYVRIGTTQAEAITTYNNIIGEVAAFKTGAAAAVPTLDNVIAGRPQGSTTRTIAQQLDRDIAARATDPSKAKSHDSRSILRKILGKETVPTLTRERVRSYCAALVWRGDKDKTITDALLHLRTVVARMIPDEDTMTRNVVMDMVVERKARQQPITAIWSEERATLSVALVARDKRKSGKCLTDDEDKALKRLIAVGKDYKPHTMRQKGLITPAALASIEHQLTKLIVKTISWNEHRYVHMSISNYLRAKHAHRRIDIRKAREVILFLRVIKGQFQRFEAMRALRWTPNALGKGNYIDFDANEFVLHDTKKTHAGWCEVEHQTLNPEIADALRRHRKHYPDGDEVFAKLPLDMSHALADYRDRADIVEMKNTKWYSLKHTGITTARGSGATALDLAAAAKVTAPTAEQYYRQEETNAAARAHANYHPISEIEAAKQGRLRLVADARKNIKTTQIDKRLTSRHKVGKHQSEARQ